MQNDVPKRSKMRMIAIVVGALLLCCVGFAVYSVLRNNTPAGEAALTRSAETRAASQSENTAEPITEAEPVETSTSEAATEAIQPTNEPPPTNIPEPTAPPEPDGLSRENAALPGSSVTADDLQITIDHITYPTAAFMEAGNTFNPKPEDGKVILMAFITFTCLADSSETCTVSPFFFKVSGSAGIVHDYIFGIVGIEDGLEIELEFFGGNTQTRWIAFEAEEGETDLILSYEPILATAAYLQLPEAVEE